MGVAQRVRFTEQKNTAATYSLLFLYYCVINKARQEVLLIYKISPCLFHGDFVSVSRVHALSAHGPFFLRPAVSLQV